MKQFTIVEEAQALVRYKNGIQKIVNLYTRNERLFTPHGIGFIAICAKVEDAFTTIHPDIKVLEIDCEGISQDRFGRPALTEKNSV